MVSKFEEKKSFSVELIRYIVITELFLQLANTYRLRSKSEDNT